MEKLSVSELLSPPVLAFVPNHTKSDWHKFVSTHQLFNDDRFIEDVAIPIKLTNGHTVDWIIPGREVILDFVHNQGQKIIIDLVLLKIIEIWSYVTKNDRKISPMKLNEYRSAIKAHLYGKSGLLSRAASAIVPIVQGKQTGFGYFPTGTVVIISEKFWRTIHKKGRDGEWADMEYEEFKRRMSLPLTDPEALQFFGFKERHPVIWTMQEANVASIWTKDRLNRYMIDRYKFSFYDYCPYFKSSKEEAIIANTLDSLVFHQEDADGDMGSVPMFYSVAIQNKMREINLNAKNYKYLYDGPYKGLTALSKNFKWHFSYVLAEVQGNTSHGVRQPVDFKMDKIDRFGITDAYLNAISSKANIATISTSNWFIQEIGKTLVKNGQLGLNQYLMCADFYQKIIAQDGVIRAVKHDAEVGMHNLTLEALTLNSKKNVIKTNHGPYSPHAYLDYLIRKAEYSEETVQGFSIILNFWRKNCGLHKGKIDPRKSTELGKMIKASIALRFGSKAGLSKGDELISCFNSPDVVKLPIYKSHKNIIDLLNSVEDKISILLKDSEESLF
jgi:hypothetical protein